MFGRKLAEEGRIKETISEELANLEAEEAIIEDKVRFGRVRNSLMRYLRVEYGSDIADRALYRVNKRRSEGYLKLG